MCWYPHDIKLLHHIEKCAGGLSVLGLAIGGYRYNKFQKPEQNLIDVPPTPVIRTNTEPKRDIFEML